MRLEARAARKVQNMPMMRGICSQKYYPTKIQKSLSKQEVHPHGILMQQWEI